MKRVVLVLAAIVVAVVASSCAVGVRQPAGDITQTSATLNGTVLSTTGGAGSWYFEYGTTEARTERTPTRPIDFEAGEIVPVAEPIDGLEPGTVYHFATCAEDSENPGDPFCSPDQAFTTDYDPDVSVTEDCSNPPSNSARVSLTGFPPNAPFTLTVQFPSGPITSPGSLSTDSNGNFSISGFTSSASGTWTATVGWSGGTLVDSQFVDCEESPSSS